ncbi:MAG: hypothetical protein ACLP01_12070 [Solirubrobacteraceae bacterium]
MVDVVAGVAVVVVDVVVGVVVVDVVVGVAVVVVVGVVVVVVVGEVVVDVVVGEVVVDVVVGLAVDVVIGATLASIVVAAAEVVVVEVVVRVADVVVDVFAVVEVVCVVTFLIGGIRFFADAGLAMLDRFGLRLLTLRVCAADGLVRCAERAKAEPDPSTPAMSIASAKYIFREAMHPGSEPAHLSTTMSRSSRRPFEWRFGPSICLPPFGRLCSTGTKSLQLPLSYGRTRRDS